MKTGCPSSGWLFFVNSVSWEENRNLQFLSSWNLKHPIDAGLAKPLPEQSQEKDGFQSGFIFEFV